MNKRTDSIKAAWEERQSLYGNVPRSVLCKNLPAWANDYLHQRHASFVLNALNENDEAILDVGCGYGRLSAEIKKTYPKIKLYGVEICGPFADQFAHDFDGCTVSSVQDFVPQTKYDAIIVVTVLMYVKRDELYNVLDTLWGALKQGGRLICIEQYENLLVRLRKNIGSDHLSPTGGDVVYFRHDELKSILSGFSGGRIVSSKSFGLLPIVNVPVLHHGFVIEKE